MRVCACVFVNPTPPHLLFCNCKRLCACAPADLIVVGPGVVRVGAGNERVGIVAGDGASPRLNCSAYVREFPYLADQLVSERILDQPLHKLALLRPVGDARAFGFGNDVLQH